MRIRRTATWMEQLDDRILEHVREEDWSTPSIMASRPWFDASERRIRERCRMLADADLIAPISGDMVELTTWGLLYLDGEIDAAHQPSPRPSRVRSDFPRTRNNKSRAISRL